MSTTQRTRARSVLKIFTKTQIIATATDVASAALHWNSNMASQVSRLYASECSVSTNELASGARCVAAYVFYTLRLTRPLQRGRFSVVVAVNVNVAALFVVEYEAAQRNIAFRCNTTATPLDPTNELRAHSKCRRREKSQQSDFFPLESPHHCYRRKNSQVCQINSLALIVCFLSVLTSH